MNAEQLCSGTELIGQPVFNLQGEYLGEIKELIVDAGEGRTVYAVLSTGGVLGIGERLRAVPWNAFRRQGRKGRVLLDLKKWRLQEAPVIHRDQLPQLTDPGLRRLVTSCYETAQ